MNYKDFKTYVMWYKQNVPYMEKWDIYKSRDLLYGMKCFNIFIKDSIWEYVWQDLEYEDLIMRFINSGKLNKSK